MEITKFAVVKDSTNVSEASKVQTAVDCANSALAAVLGHFKLPTDPNADLARNKSFLAVYAKEVIASLKAARLENYNAVVGNNLTRVLRYEKNSLITLFCGNISLVLFKCPSNPMHPAADASYKQGVDAVQLEVK